MLITMASECAVLDEEVLKQEPLITVMPHQLSRVAESESKVYGRRWIILALFICSSMINTWQWIQYAIIANIITRYYGVSDLAVEMTSMVYMMIYIPLIFPASYLVDKWGLRMAAILSAVGTAAGSWVKVASVSPDRFTTTFIGQTILAIAQTFILSIPPQLAAVWFGPEQVSTACSMGVFGIQLGIAIGFIVTPILVRNHDNVEDIGRDLNMMFICVAILSTLVLVLVVIFFERAPPLPPSRTKKNDKMLTSSSFINSLQRLVLNSSFNLLLVSYGINVGNFYAISTLLNQMILIYFKNGEEFAGQVGLIIVVTGMLGSVACGVVLDKTRKFKETTLAVYILTLFGLLLFTFTIGVGSKVVVLTTSATLGFFMTGYLMIGLELAVELTYPEAENTSAGLLNASAQVFGILLTLLYGWMLGSVGDVLANLTLCATLAVGTVLTLLIKSDLRRQRAHIEECHKNPSIKYRVQSQS